MTGVKFVITAEAGTPDLGAVLQEIYELYTDYVLKVNIVQQGDTTNVWCKVVPEGSSDPSARLIVVI